MPEFFFSDSTFFAVRATHFPQENLSYRTAEIVRLAVSEVEEKTRMSLLSVAQFCAGHRDEFQGHCERALFCCVI
jgi:hypothetical protein